MELGEKLIDFRLLGADDSYFDTKKNKKTKKNWLFLFICNHCPYVHAYEVGLFRCKKNLNHIVQFVGINSNDDTRYPEDSF